MSINLILLVGVGGGLGSLGRYLLSTLFASHNPWVTLIINIVGGFLIGFLYRFTEHVVQAESVRAFWMVGFCGGFTTFSTFGLDFFHLFSNHQISSGLVYVLISVLGTILAVFLGMRTYTFLG